MQEITRIITLEITEVFNGSEEELASKERCKKELEKFLQREIEPDHVMVTNVQDFVMDEEGNDGKVN